MMRPIRIIALAGALCIGACDRNETVKPAVPPHAEGAQHPYYYGLIEEFRTQLAEDPNNLAAIIALGNAYYDSGNWQQASGLYARALAIDPRNPDIRTDLGTCYRNLGKPDRALEEYHAALRYDIGHLNSRYNMGIVYAHDKKDYPAAVRAWEELLKIAPNYPRAKEIHAMIEAAKKTFGRHGR